MSKTALYVILGAVVAMGIMYLVAPEHDMSNGLQVNPDGSRRALNLPWQISVDRETSEVFGIRLNESTLSEGEAALKAEMALAWFDNPDDSFSIEAFFKHVTLAGLKAKVVLEVDSSGVDKAVLYKNSGQPEILPSKSIKYPIADLSQTLAGHKIQSITYIPAINLDEELIKSRFGEPEKVININAERVHWLYPSKGLDISLNKKAKEVLQYVSPKDFKRLEQSLEIEKQKAAKAAKQKSIQG